MKLFTIYAFDKKKEDDPVGGYLVVARTEDEAMAILKGTDYYKRHVRFAFAPVRQGETELPGPGYLGWFGGPRMLKADGRR